MAKKKTNQTWRSWLLIASIAFLFFSMYRMNPNQPKVRELSQLEFYKALEQGKIVEPVVRHLDRDEGETYLAGEMESDELDKNGDPLKNAYRLALVPGENEQLMADLLEAQIKVIVKERKSPFSPFVVQLLFFFGFLFMLWIHILASSS